MASVLGKGTGGLKERDEICLDENMHQQEKQKTSAEGDADRVPRLDAPRASPYAALMNGGESCPA